MKFAHLADVHLGGHRDLKLRELNTRSFCAIIDRCIAENADFVLIAGDLFNTSSPSFDALKICVQKFRELRDRHISVYLIPGSHDFSPSGKTMIDVLEQAGLAVNVAKGEVVDGKLALKFTIDAKTGCKITGMFGKKGGLEKHYYYELIKDRLEAEPGPKIFMFHSPIAELKPEELAGMDAMPLSLLPQGFDYYAGGHVHVVQHEKLKDYPNVVYPGPGFPNNFAELEKLECGSFVLWDNGTITHERIKLKPVVKIHVNAQHKTAAEVNAILDKHAGAHGVQDAIVLLRVEGLLSQGKPSDVRFTAFTETCMGRGAHLVLKNTHKLESKELEEIKVHTASVEDIEEALIKEHAGQLKILPADQEIALARELMRVLAAEKDEGERVADFEKRVSQDVDRLLGL